MLLIILAVILAILILILFAPLKVKVSFKNSDIKVKVSLFGIPLYKLKPSLETEEKNSGNKSSAESIEDKVKEFESNTMTLGEKIKLFAEVSRTALRLLKRYVTVKDISLKASIGTGDAATTAISVGILWAAVYNLLGIIGRVVYIDNHSVEIAPDYGEENYLISGKCIFKSRIAYIIFIVIVILLKINSRKGKED